MIPCSNPKAQYFARKKFEDDVSRKGRKMMGLWAAGKLGLADQDAEDYADSIFLKKEQEVVRMVQHDLEAKGVTMTEAQLNSQLAVCQGEARKQLSADPVPANGKGPSR